MGLKKHSGQEVDLDATDELPALDSPFPGELPGEAQASTDVFPTPVFPAGMVELADSLRDVEQRLQRKLERVARLESELEQSAAEARELRERLQVQEQSQLGVLAEAQQRLNQRDSEHTHASRDAAEWRRRAERHYEVLTTWQTFRSVSEAMIGEAERVVGQEESRRAAELAAATARAQEAEVLLGTARADAARRIAELEESLRAAMQAQQAQTGALQAARDETASASRELASRDASIAGLRQQLADAQDDATQRIEALEESLRESEQAQDEQMAALHALTTQTVELRAGLEAREVEARQLQEQLQELRSVEEKARKGAVVFEVQLRQIGSLQTDLAAAEARIRELEQQLHKSGDRVQRLESEAHASAALLANLQQNMNRLGRDDTGPRPVLKEVLPETVRVLVRQEGGADVVYRLARRTTIGRTAENDIQVDTTFVSRHHAVLLSSADHCIVEDLNSTNGVLVNGRRVGRHILQDGDMVTVGKTEFRYQQRS